MVLVIAILNDGKIIPRTSMSIFITVCTKPLTLVRFLVFLIYLHLISLRVLFLGTIMTISKDRVKPSPVPDSWKLSEIFATGVIIGSYLALMTVLFFFLAYKTSFFAVSTLV